MGMEDRTVALVVVLVLRVSHHGPAPTPGRGLSNSGSESDSRTEATPVRSNNDGEYSMGSPANDAESEQG